MFGRKGEKPLFPVNILGDFAGGGMLCAMGTLCVKCINNKKKVFCWLYLKEQGLEKAK